MPLLSPPLPCRRPGGPWARRLALALLVLLSLSGAARADDMSIHVIQRADAEALLPVIRPLLPEGGYANAYQGKLVIRTDDRNFDEILGALGDMPEVPRTVTVQLRRQGDSSGAGGDIRINGQGVRAGANTVTTRRQDRYSINTLSGHPAGISQGSLVALTGTQFPALLALKQGIDITPVITSDGRVRLTIEQRFDEPAGRQSARTQRKPVRHRLGRRQHPQRPLLPAPGSQSGNRRLLMRIDRDTAPHTGGGLRSAN
jgi:hypothetical protein